MNQFDIAFGSYDTDPSKYFIADESGLKKAILLALKLSKPLLITGEPGIGKTQLAYWAAKILSEQTSDNLLPFIDKPYIFITKSKSESNDLYYQYDAISHFQDKEGKKNVAEFINLSAMGLAICQTYGFDINWILESNPLRGIKNLNAVKNTSMSSVVLIDEVDKAPRDFTNDLLDEIENNHFHIKEINTTIKRNDERKARILTILTSNSETNLPEPFLRRCLFFNIEFPADRDLLQIIFNRISPFLNEISQNYSTYELESKYKSLITLFKHIRDDVKNKPPSISELLDWIKILHLEGLVELIDEDFTYSNINTLSDENKKLFRLSLLALLKNKEDIEEINSIIN